jgi:hypothetical protein
MESGILIQFNFKNVMSMGTYVKGILGNFSGKVGTVIGSNWKTVNYMRSLSGKRKGTPSSAQLEQQMKFMIMVKFHQSLQALLNLTFAKYSKMMSPYNYAIKHNLLHAITGTYPNFSIDYHKLLLSQGILIPASSMHVEGSGAGKIKFSWTDNSGSGNADASDKAILIAYNPLTFQSLYITNAALRSAGEYVMDASLFSGNGVETWMAFISDDGKTVSNSSYLGNVMVE